jgi:hypothetical protein
VKTINKIPSMGHRLIFIMVGTACSKEAGGYACGSLSSLHSHPSRTGPGRGARRCVPHNNDRAGRGGLSGSKANPYKGVNPGPL